MGEGHDRLSAVADEPIGGRDHAVQRRRDQRGPMGNTASAVAPSRSRATRIGMFSKKRPGCLALPPRLRGGRGRPDLWPLNDLRMKVSSASTMPLSVLGLSSAGEPRNRRRQRRPRGGDATFGGLRHAGSLDHRLGVVEPLLLLAQPRHRRLRQGVERAPAALAAERQPSARPQATMLRPAQWGQPRRSTFAWPMSPSASSRTRRCSRASPSASAAGASSDPRAAASTGSPKPDATSSSASSALQGPSPPVALRWG